MDRCIHVFEITRQKCLVCNGDDCSGADRCQRQMKGGEARAALCFFQGPAKGLKKKQQAQLERQRRKQGGAVGAAASRMQAERSRRWEPQPGFIMNS